MIYLRSLRIIFILDYDWQFLKRKWISPTSIIRPSSTSCSKPANSRKDSAVKKWSHEPQIQAKINANAWTNMQNYTQAHSNTNACMLAHSEIKQQSCLNHTNVQNSNQVKTWWRSDQWDLDSPMFISSSVRVSPMKSNWNDWRVWENFCTASEYSENNTKNKSQSKVSLYNNRKPPVTDARQRGFNWTP